MISPRTRAIVLSVAGALLLSPAAVHADTIAVDITSDDFDVVPDADCSVREAVQTANVDANFGGCAQTGTSSGPDTITIPAGTYTLTGAAGENLNLSGDLDIVNVQPPTG